MVISQVGSVNPGASAPGRPAPPPAAALPAAAAPAPVDDAQLKEAIAAANRAVASHSSSVEFSVDPRHGKTIVRVTDKNTGQLIRQMPSEEMIEIAQALEQFQGLLIRSKA